jgi:hypothetical protein
MVATKYQPLTLAPINFSLTEGTSIPAPPESPPETPRPPTPGRGPLDSHPRAEGETPPPKDSSDSQLHKTTSSGGGSVTLSPTSPTSKRPASVRKFLGLRSLSSSDSLRSERPGSPATIDSKPSLSRKKSSGWFGRRKSSYGIGSVPEGNKVNHTNQGSGVSAQKEKTPPQKKGPPPPALPDLSSFGVSEDTTSLGADDLFKDIK